MPHGRSADGDDFASTDEVKVYKDEGEDEKRSSENLSEEKLGLVTETEEVQYNTAVNCMLVTFELVVFSSLCTSVLLE